MVLAYFGLFLSLHGFPLDLLARSQRSLENPSARFEGLFTPFSAAFWRALGCSWKIRGDGSGLTMPLWFTTRRFALALRAMLPYGTDCPESAEPCWSRRFYRLPPSVTTVRALLYTV
jgi:hypothetical protein